MSIQYAPVIYADHPPIRLPNITGKGLWRRQLQIYNDRVYAEYFVTGSKGSADLLTVNKPVIADIYMVSPGVTGTAGTKSVFGTSGAAGLQYTQMDVALSVGTYYSVNCDVTYTNLYQTGVGEIARITQSTTASVFTYYLFDDEQFPCGTTSIPTAGKATSPALGSNGCMYLSNPVQKAEDYYTSISALSAWGLSSACGIGCGGRGGQLAIGSTTTHVGSKGGNGICIIRVPLEET